MNGLARIDSPVLADRTPADWIQAKDLTVTKAQEIVAALPLADWIALLNQFTERVESGEVLSLETQAFAWAIIGLEQAIGTHAEQVSEADFFTD